MKTPTTISTGSRIHVIGGKRYFMPASAYFLYPATVMANEHRQSQGPTIDEVEEAVLAATMLHPQAIRAKSRKADVVTARAIIWHIYDTLNIANRHKLSLVKMGARYNLHHATVHYAMKRLKGELDVYPETNGLVRAIINTLRPK